MRAKLGKARMWGVVVLIGVIAVVGLRLVEQYRARAARQMAPAPEVAHVDVRTLSGDPEVEPERVGAGYRIELGAPEPTSVLLFGFDSGGGLRTISDLMAVSPGSRVVVTRGGEEFNFTFDGAGAGRVPGGPLYVLGSKDGPALERFGAHPNTEFIRQNGLKIRTSEDD